MQTHYYDATEKTSRDGAAMGADAGLYDSIAATAFTKYQQLVPIAISAMFNIEATVRRFEGIRDVNIWGQAAAIVGAVFIVLYFSHAVYCMFFRGGTMIVTLIS